MSAINASVTQDFQEMIPGAVLMPTDLLDTRNGIYARNPTYTKESYLGYLQITKELVMKQPALGSDYMLRLGFIPLVMPPSFWGDKAHNMILPKLPKSLPYYPRPAISFLNFKYQRYHSDYPDIWISKMDAAELCCCKPELVTVRGVLDKCGI